MIEEALVFFGAYATLQTALTIKILKHVMHNNQILNNGLIDRVKKIEHWIDKRCLQK
jgi:hypothetical protein